nr:hypothetical protein [Oscillospiraceae bacterium]
MKKLNVMKRTLAGVLAVLTVAGYTLPANVGSGGFLTGNTQIVAKALYPNMDIGQSYTYDEIARLMRNGAYCYFAKYELPDAAYNSNWNALESGGTYSSYVLGALRKNGSLPGNDGTATYEQYHSIAESQQTYIQSRVWILVGQPAATETDTKFGDCIFKAGTETAAQADEYAVVVASSTYGTVTASKTAAKEGETITLTVTPNNAQCSLQSLTVTNTTNNTSVVVSNNSFTMPKGNVKVTPVFVYTQKLAPTYSITPAQDEIIYDGTAKPLVNVSGSGGTIHYNVNNGGWTTNTPTATNAGEYEVDWYSDANDTYSGSGSASDPNTVTVRVLKRPITIHWGDTVFTYNRTEQCPTATFDGFLAGHENAYTITGGKTNAGTNYTATAKLTNSNYQFSNQSDTTTTGFSIVPKKVGITWSNTAFTYDAASHCPTATITGFISGDGEPVVISGAQTNAGSYTAKARISDANYTYEDGHTSSEQAFTISRKEISLEWKNTAFTYDGDSHLPTATAKGLAGSDTCTVTVTGAKTNAGTYTATAAELSNLNYKLPANNTTSYKINPKVINFNWSDTAFTYDTKAHKPTATATNLCGSDSCEITVSGEQTNAGTYTATASALSNTNYMLPDAAFTSTEFKINPFVVGLSWSNLQFTYDKTSHLPTATATEVYSSDTCNVTVSGAATNAGTYTATAASLSNANYALPENKTQGFTIAPKTVELAWSNAAFTYDGTAQAPAATATNLCSGDSCDVTVSGAKTDFGTYTATASALSNQNYTLPAEADCLKDFSIAQREVGITWGTNVFEVDGNDHRPEVTLTNVVDGDDCTPTVTGATPLTGAHTAEVTALSNGNYKLPATGTTKAFSILTKLNLTKSLAPKNYITSYSYNGTTVTEDFDDVYSVLCENQIVLKSIGALKFSEDLDVYMTKSNGIYTYTFSIPEGIAEVNVEHEFKYSVRTSPSDSTLLIGYDKNDTTNSSSNMFDLAKLYVNNTEYLQPLEVVVTPFENIFLNVESVTYEFTPDTNDVALVDGTPFYVGDYTVTAGARVEEADYWLSDSFSITPRAYTAHMDEITAALEQEEFAFANADITPVVTVTDNSNVLEQHTLVEGVDYDLSGDLTKQDAGNYTIHVTFKGNYSGETDLAWSITAQKLQTIE